MTPSPDDGGAFVPGGRFVVPPTGTGALDGLTFAVKDLIDVAGRVTGAGNPDWGAASPPAAGHAAAVATLLSAGATLTGKTVTDELAFSLEGANAHFGTPRNPRHPDWLPGGSSSGSASAVAQGLVDFALGTDTGGSVRVPSAFCGICGFRPSHGAVNAAGLHPFAPSYDTIGWMAREMAVLAAVGHVLLPAQSAPPITTIRLAADLLDFVSAEVATDMERAATTVANAPSVRLLNGLAVAELTQVYADAQAGDIRCALGASLAEVRPRFGGAIAERFAGALGVTEAAAASARKRRAEIAAQIARHVPPGTALIVPASSRPFLLRSITGPELGDFYAVTLGLNAVAGHGGLPQLQLPPLDGAAIIGPSLIAARGADRALLQLGLSITARARMP